MIYGNSIILETAVTLLAEKACLIKPEKMTTKYTDLLFLCLMLYYPCSRCSLVGNVLAYYGFVSNMNKKKTFLRRFPFSRFLAKILRVNKPAMKNFLKKSVVRS